MKTYRFDRKVINQTIKMTNGDQAIAERFAVTCWVSTPKGKYAKEKIVFSYWFKTSEAREQYIEKFMEQKKENERVMTDRKAVQRKAQEEVVNPFKVGEILYDSWGYEQTNIDFFQIIEVGKKSVKIRKIGQKLVREAGWLCEYVAPAIDDFTGEAKTKVLRVYVGDQTGKVTVTVSGLCRYTYGEKGVYQSHYA